MLKTRRSLAATMLVAVLLGAGVLALPTGPRAAERAKWIVAFEAPERATLEALALRADLDVRWVERGLVIGEVDDMRAVADLQPVRVLAQRAASEELGLLRGAERRAWTKPGAAPAAIAQFVMQRRVADAHAAAGDVLVLLAPAESWPDELRGCHGELILPAHHADPRSLIDAGPPAVLAAYLAQPVRPLGAAAQAIVEAVSADSLRAHENLITLDPLAHPADRYVFNANLEGIYIGRVQTVMERALAGIPGARVARQRFLAVQTPHADSTSNVIARLPGTTPGTGTFVVGAHLDATGIRDAAWLAAVAAGQPVQTPGGEDNASGVACVLEVLRCLADARRTGGAQFAFDVEFVAFSAEEIGLQGSEYYVRQAVAGGVPLLGTFNFDMVGYQRPPANLQLVYNDASRWLADAVRDAAPTLAPPSTLHLTPELDEARASDHNSFWVANGPAILLADATIDSLRGYTTYHKPIDLGSLVDVTKMAEVSRLVLATMLRFDTQAAPQLLFEAPDFQLLRTVQGAEVVYRPGYHRLYPGAALSAAVVVRSAGREFSGQLRLQIDTHGPAGDRRVLDSLSTPSLPTLARWSVVQPVPIQPTDGGWNRIVARVTYADSAGQPVVQAVTDSFNVDVTSQPALQVILNPNPVRGDPASTMLEIVTLNLPGTLTTEVFDMEGQRVATSVRDVVPRVTEAKYSFRLLDGSGAPAGLASGTYLVRVQWHGASGQGESAMKPWVVIR